MPTDELHVVLGASGGVGNAVVRALVAQGKRVRGVTRSGKADVPDGVEMLAADITLCLSCSTKKRNLAVL